MEKFTVRRFALVVAFALLGVGGIAGSSGQDVLARDATPGTSAGSESITYRPLGYVPGIAMPDAVNMEIARGTLDPDAGFPFSAEDPAAVMMIVESGEITATVQDATWTISRGAAVAAVVTGTPTAGEPTEVVEVVRAGEAATFAAGDVAYIPGNSTGELHNAGDEPAVTLLVTYLPSLPE